MTHELKRIIQAYNTASKEGHSAVLATVVALEGSSYRRPGVRMLILSDGRMIGAVSGGCVEKEIARQASDVFKSNKPKIMTYDGRYRLGCEGILYILIEPFNPQPSFIDSFWSAVDERKHIGVKSFFNLETGSSENYGSLFKLHDDWNALRQDFNFSEDQKVLEQSLEPSHQLIIIGAEHDAVQLCSYAAMTGWEVAVIASPAEQKTLSDFPGAKNFRAQEAENFDTSRIDEQTSVVLMTHSYVKDLSFLIALKNTLPKYIGLLGPVSRREKLLNEFSERIEDLSLEFLDNIYGPSGLDLGAVTPQEIAISIVSEILSVYRQSDPIPLRDKNSAIHNS